MDAMKLDAECVVADAKLAMEALADALKQEGYKAQWGNEIDNAKRLGGRA